MHVSGVAHYLCTDKAIRFSDCDVIQADAKFQARSGWSAKLSRRRQYTTGIRRWTKLAYIRVQGRLGHLSMKAAHRLNQRLVTITVHGNAPVTLLLEKGNKMIV